MVGVGGEPGFLAGSFLQQPLGGLSADLLELGAEALVAVPDPVQPFAAVPGAVAGGGDVSDAQVDAEEPVRFLGFDVGDVAGGVQVPLAVPAHQVGFALAVRDQRGVLSVGAGERELVQSAADRPDRHGAVGQLPGQAAVVERLSRVPAKRDRLALGLGPPIGAGLAEVPGPNVRLQGGVCPGDLAGDVDRRLRRQPHVLQPALGQPLQRLLGEHPPPERLSRGVVRGGVAQV